MIMIMIMIMAWISGVPAREGWTYTYISLRSPSRVMVTIQQAGQRRDSCLHI